MSWQKELDEKARREAMTEQMGGADKLARQAARGKLNARERLELLLDKDSFREIGKLAGKGHYDEKGDLVHLSATNFIFGRGDINARPVVATADDFTVRGGRPMRLSIVNLHRQSKWRGSCDCRLSV